MSGEISRLNATEPMSRKERKAAEKAEEARKEQERQNVAAKLIAQLSNQEEYANLETDDLEKKLKAELKERYKDTDKDMYKSSLKALDNAIEKTEEAREAYAQQLVRRIAGMAPYTDDKEVRAFVRAGLAAEFEEGNISKEVYDYARKYGETKKGTHFFKSVWRGVFGGTKESSEVYRSVGQNNNVEEIRNNGKPLELDAELQAKLKKAGITKEMVYQIGDNLVGSEAVVSYSNKKVQAGEAQFIADAFDEFALKNGVSDVDFTDKEAKQIMKAAGYGIEKKIDAKKVIRDAATVGIPSAAAGIPLITTQTQNVNLGEGLGSISQSQKVVLGPVVTAALGTALGTLGSIKEQAVRVEDKAIPVHIDDSIKTFDDYAAFIKKSDSFPSKQAKAMAMKIAAYYTTEDGTLLKDKLIDAYRHAGGSADVDDTQNADYSDASVLNHREALALLTKLESGKIKVDKPEPPKPEPEERDVLIQSEEYVEKVDETSCYKVKSGDNWNSVVIGKYKPKTNEDRKALIRILKDATFEEMKKSGTLPKGITSSRDAFFPKVGDELCIPSEITLPNGNKYTYLEEGKVISEAPSKNYKGATYKANSNPFLTERKGTTWGSYAQEGPLAEGTTEEKARQAANDYKKEQEAKGRKVTVSEHHYPIEK